MAPPRVTLRPFEEADALALHPIFADARAMRYWSSPPHASLAETETFVAATMAASLAGEGDDQVVLLDERVIGKAGLWNNREIGFIFAPDTWGQGLASEAVAAVIARARKRGVARILADVDPRNGACIRLLERLDFSRTGAARATATVGGEVVDSVYFELIL